MRSVLGNDAVPFACDFRPSTISTLYSDLRRVEARSGLNARDPGSQRRDEPASISHFLSLSQYRPLPYYRAIPWIQPYWCGSGVSFFGFLCFGFCLQAPYANVDPSMNDDLDAGTFHHK
jgi:hypothetical protein